MTETQELLARMDQFEMLILRATMLLLLIIACAYIILIHVKPIYEEFKGKGKRDQP